jgi:hypothetical protein
MEATRWLKPSVSGSRWSRQETMSHQTNGGSCVSNVSAVCALDARSLAPAQCCSRPGLDCRCSHGSGGGCSRPRRLRSGLPDCPGGSPGLAPSSWAFVPQEARRRPNQHATKKTTGVLDRRIRLEPDQAGTIGCQYNYVFLRWMPGSAVFDRARASGLMAANWQDVILVNMLGQAVLRRDRGQFTSNNFKAVDPYVPGSYLLCGAPPPPDNEPSWRDNPGFPAGVFMRRLLNYPNIGSPRSTCHETHTQSRFPRPRARG